MSDIMTSGRWNEVPAIREQIIDGIRKLARDQSLGLRAIDLKANYVSVYYENKRYVRETDAIHRLLRILTTLPPSVEYFYLTSMANFVGMNEVYQGRFSPPYPARTTVAVAELPLNAMIEIELVAEKSQ